MLICIRIVLDSELSCRIGRDLGIVPSLVLCICKAWVVCSRASHFLCVTCGVLRHKEGSSIVNGADLTNVLLVAFVLTAGYL